MKSLGFGKKIQGHPAKKAEPGSTFATTACNVICKDTTFANEMLVSTYSWQITSISIVYQSIVTKKPKQLLL